MQVRFACPKELDGRLVRPKPARQGLPDWLKAMPQEAEEPQAGFAVRTVKQCPPFLDAMGHGFLMPLATDLTVKERRFSWDWDLPQNLEEAEVTGYSRAPISTHFAAQAKGTPLFDEKRLTLKFNNFWTIGLPEGWSLLVTHPINRPDLPFQTLTGLVDCDLFNKALVHFPAIWTDECFEGVLSAGTPVAQCIPVKREALEFSFETLEGETARDFMALQDRMAEEPGVYRKDYRSRA